jgi:hypothetical protein
MILYNFYEKYKGQWALEYLYINTEYCHNRFDIALSVFDDIKNVFDDGCDVYAASNINSIYCNVRKDGHALLFKRDKMKAIKHNLDELNELLNTKKHEIEF